MYIHFNMMDSNNNLFFPIPHILYRFSCTHKALYTSHRASNLFVDVESSSARNEKLFLVLDGWWIWQTHFCNEHDTVRRMMKEGKLRLRKNEKKNKRASETVIRNMENTKIMRRCKRKEQEVKNILQTQKKKFCHQACRVVNEVKLASVCCVAVHAVYISAKINICPDAHKQFYDSELFLSLSLSVGYITFNKVNKSDSKCLNDHEWSKSQK